MSIKVNNDGIERLFKSIESIEKQQSVKLGDLLNPEFMSKHTQFSSLNEMFDSSGLPCETEDEFNSMPRNKLDEFITNNTEFNSWDDMIRKAGAEHIDKQIRDGLK